MVEILPELAGLESKIVPVFHNQSTFNDDEDQRYFRLEKDEQILKLKSCGRGLMISVFVCTCHGRMVDTDTREPSRVILKYGKNYDSYQTVEDVAKQLEEFHVTFLKLHGGALALYIFDNSSNHHNIATDALNAKKLNLKDEGRIGPF